MISSRQLRLDFRARSGCVRGLQHQVERVLMMLNASPSDLWPAVKPCLAQQARALQPRRQAGSLRSHQLAGTLGTLRDAPSYPGMLREGRGPAAGTLRGTQRESASVLGTLREARSPGEGASPAETLQGGGAGAQQGAAEEGLAGAGVGEEGASGGVVTGTLRGTAGGPGRPGEPLGAPAGDRSGAPTVVRSSRVRVTMCYLPYRRQVW